jgi:hypothetical protein
MKFNYSSLDDRFLPYYATRQNVKVLFSWGEVQEGIVSLEKGKEPAFFLVFPRRSHTVRYYLTAECIILGGK